MSSFTAHACVSKSINRYGRIGSGCLGGDNITDRRTDKRTETRFKNFDIVITRMKNYLHLTFFLLDGSFCPVFYSCPSTSVLK